MSDLLQRGFDACAKGLTEFGYKGDTADMIKEAHDRWKRGEEQPTIIGKLAERDFNECPEIFGTKDAEADNAG